MKNDNDEENSSGSRTANLDETDFEILRQLQNNARISNKDLAERIGLAPSTTLVRTRQLERAGIIRSYRAAIDPAALGIGLQALIAVRLREHTAADVAAFQDYVLGLPEVMRFYHVAGADDFLVHVGVRDSDALRDFAMSALTTRPEVAHLETGLIFSCVEAGDVSDGMDKQRESSGAPPWMN
jgi:DNA-binding Lrp family transcriptional regulator